MGLWLGSGISRKYSLAVFQAIGLFVVFLGIAISLKANHLMVVVLSLVCGGLTGTWMDLDARIQRFSDGLKARLSGAGHHFSQGLISASLLFCMGSMAILGSIDEGLGRGSQLLLTKSVMDGFAAVALAAAWGRGVVFSAIPVLLYQGGLTAMAFGAGDFLSEPVVLDVSATGGILLLGLGISILELAPIQIIHFVPALVYAALFSWIQQLFF